MSEQWAPIPGYEGLYEVSDQGRVRSWHSHWKALPRDISISGLGKGYPFVTLCRDGGKRRTNLHVLVASAFLGPRPLGLEVRHLDGNPENNTVDNLAWGTHTENQLDQVRHGTNRNSLKTHCPQDHPYSPENTIREGRGRRCRICKSDRSHRRHLARKAAA